MAKKDTNAAPTATVTLAQLHALNIDHLHAIVNAQGGVIYVPDHVSGPLAAAGLVETDPTNVDANGHVLTRATPAGTEHLIAFGSDTGGAQLAIPVVTKPQFTIDDAIPLPVSEKKTRAPRGSIYPFEQLALADGAKFGQSFFVPNSAEKPDAAKALASTISSANARYAELVPGQTQINRKGREVPATRQLRRFIVRSVEENGVKGARVWRVAVE